MRSLTQTSSLLWLLAVACTGQTDSTDTPEPDTDTADTDAPQQTPVHITVVGHIENGIRYTKCDQYPTYRQGILDFVELLQGTGVTFNLQIEYEFFTGASTCETAEMQATTDGKNVVDYMAQYYGVEIDAHQEGGWQPPDAAGPDNYADIRYLGGQLTSLISENVGGFVWDEGDEIAVLSAGQPGNLHPEFTWTPQVLTMAVGRQHHLGDFDWDDKTSGVWIPAGTQDDFRTHDQEGSLVYVGPGQHHSNWGGGACEFHDAVEYAEVLLDYLQQGRIEQGGLYTATYAVPQSVMFDASRHSEVTDVLERAAPLVASGDIVFSSYSQVAELWRTQHDSQPTLFTFDQIDPEDYGCD